MFVYHDGGRTSSGFKGKNDCAIRAMAIACDISYCEARNILKESSRDGKMGSGAISKGVYKEDLESALSQFGFKRKRAPKFEGRKARYQDIPKGRVVVRMARHFAAVVDGVLYDTFDSSEKMVYSYWVKETEK